MSFVSSWILFKTFESFRIVRFHNVDDIHFVCTRNQLTDTTKTVNILCVVTKERLNFKSVGCSDRIPFLSRAIIIFLFSKISKGPVHLFSIVEVASTFQSDLYFWSRAGGIFWVSASSTLLSASIELNYAWAYSSGLIHFYRAKRFGRTYYWKSGTNLKRNEN